MVEKREVDICEVLRDDEAIEQAFEEAAQQARRDHQRSGLPLVEWRDGKVVHVDPFSGELVDPPGDSPEEKAKYFPVPYYLHAL